MSNPLPTTTSNPPGSGAAAAAQALGLSALPPAVFNMREMRESLALAEQLARASMLTDQVKSCKANNPVLSVTDSNNNNSDGSNKDVVAAVASSPSSGSYVPPKQLLLYLVRMGSFTSAPKMVNEDLQDDDVDLTGIETAEQMKERCRKELAGLPERIQRHFSRDRSPDRNGRSIRVFQWNMLSQSLGQHNDHFACCPPEALDWPTRRFRILEEILEYSPDILCLQEVDHYQFFSRALRTQGYSGTYFPKPDSPCIYIKGNNGPDGCAIFYRADAYELVRVETRVVEVWRVQSNQVVILAVLRQKSSGREFCVATTHLKARQGALLSTLRNEQGKDILDFLSTHSADKMPVILAGDFNAEPSEPVYSTIRADGRFSLESAYRDEVTGQEPPYTTWKVREEGECCHTIDYVFYSRNHLAVQQVLPFPTGEEIGSGRVPSLQYPSDHFSLVVDFELLDETDQTPSTVLNKLLCV